jgi:hypothetical protein
MSDREDRVRRLARLLCYNASGRSWFKDDDPILTNPRWLEDAEAYIDYVLTGGIVK